MPTDLNMVTAADHNFTIYSGDTFNCTLTFTDDLSNPINLTGSTVKLQVKKSETATVVEASLVSPTDITIGGGGNNVLTLNKIISIAGGNYKYDLQVIFPSGRVTTYLKGLFTVIKDIAD